MRFMNPKIRFTIAIIIILGANFIYSCTKDDVTLTNDELLTQDTWVIKSKTINPIILVGGMAVSNILELEADSVRNYSYKYNINGSFIQYDHNNSIILQASWQLSSDQTELSLSQPLVFTYPVMGDLYVSALKIESITPGYINTLISFDYEGINYVVQTIFESK